jgi:DNA-binding NtrC family response regulator
MGLAILLVDDEQDVQVSLSRFMTKLGHRVECASDAALALARFHADHFDVVISDIRMPGMDGLELLSRLKRVQASPVDVIVITGHGDMDNAISALKFGAFDYLRKPIDVRELAVTLERIAELKRLRNNYRQLKTEFRQRVEEKTQAIRGEAERLRQAYLQEVGLGELRVFSGVMRAVLDLAQKYAEDPTLPVLITGESGTGKELIARYLHYSQALDPLRPFVALNCGAISPQLFEGEFFGHEAGAYTGATASGQKGKLEAAHGGTIFLDEIGEMPPGLQVKLLRVLEDSRFYRVGGTREVSISVRVISATNQDLAAATEAGRFRTDLYYRVNAGAIRIPPLRERREEIIPFALHFATRAAKRRGRDFGGMLQHVIGHAPLGSRELLVARVDDHQGIGRHVERHELKLNFMDRQESGQYRDTSSSIWLNCEIKFHRHHTPTWGIDARDCSRKIPRHPSPRLAHLRKGT